MDEDEGMNCEGMRKGEGMNCEGMRKGEGMKKGEWMRI